MITVGKFEIALWTLLMLAIGGMIGIWYGIYLEKKYSNPHQTPASQIIYSGRK
jgi:uncharacterized membrane protein YfcA